jgi:hypothetical protein
MVQSVMCQFVGMLELEIVKLRMGIGRHQLLPNVRDVVGHAQKRSAINKFIHAIEYMYFDK